jgi:hypothetical protein
MIGVWWILLVELTNGLVLIQSLIMLVQLLKRGLLEVIKPLYSHGLGSRLGVQSFYSDRHALIVGNTFFRVDSSLLNSIGLVTTGKPPNFS